MLAGECERLFLELVLGSVEDGDGSFEGEVGVEEGKQAVGVAVAAAGGADERAGDFDPGPGAGDCGDLRVVEESEGLLVAVFVSEVGAREDG